MKIFFVVLLFSMATKFVTEDEKTVIIKNYIHSECIMQSETKIQDYSDELIVVSAIDFIERKIFSCLCSFDSFDFNYRARLFIFINALKDLGELSRPQLARKGILC